MLDAVYSPHWLTADSSLLAGEHLGFADVNDNEVTSTGEPVALLLLIVSSSSSSSSSPLSSTAFEV